MKDQKPSLNPIDESEMTTAVFNAKLKSARIKSAVVAALPTIAIFTTFIILSPIRSAIATLIASFLFIVVPFTFIYQLAFYLGFGKELAPELSKKRRFKSTSFINQTDSHTTDMFNAANGYGPGIGFIMTPKHKD